MSSPFAGALMITFWAPASRCARAFSASVKMPVDSRTMSTPEVAPRQGRRVLLGEDLDLAAVDDQGVVRVLDRARGRRRRSSRA